MAYNNEENTYKKVFDILEAARGAGQRLEYVKKIIQGNQREILTDDMPVIILHCRKIGENWHAMPKQKKATMELEVRGVMPVADRFQPFYNDANGKGILTLDGDIKDVLETDLSEGGTTLRPDISTETLRAVGEETWETVISVRLFMNLFTSSERS